MKNPRSALSKLLLVVLSLHFAAPRPAAQAAAAAPAYKNPKLPLARRVDDLVARMTLAEKIAQMQNAAAAVERLGVPEYDWWNEALHGVARAGIATVFPQAIGLAATFDENLVGRVADVVSTEGRAKYNYFQSRGDRGRYKGLTFWSPNINIFRDPRWGRGQETWGEDPFLTGTLGAAYVRGLQGDDPKYLKTVSTVKHYAVHSGPEPERHGFDAVVDERDLRETYLPAFRQTIVEGRAAGVMCAYNSMNGEPACANTRLMREILRGEWGFTGHVVSDCAAIEDIWKWHKFVATETEAAALAVRRGTDLTCGKEYKSLAEAVEKGLIAEAEIDAAVKNLMTIRFRLGLFDPPSMVKWAQISPAEYDTPAHRALAREAARASMVLLKNQDRTLPLRKDLETLAVIGPNAADAEVLLGNYNGQPSRPVMALAGIREKVSKTTKVLYSPGLYPPGVTSEPIAADALASGGAPGLKAEYFNNRELAGAPALVRTDAQINFNWGSTSPAAEIADDNFSVRWTGRLAPPESGVYKLAWRSNGGVRVFVDDRLVLEELKNPRTRNLSAEIALEAGKTYDLRVEYFENANHYASARLLWTPPTAAARLRADALEKARAADAVVMVMGITPTVEGEEMDVKLAGFRGGDRTDIALPEPQEELIREVRALGKPVVLVLMGGSALAVNWADANVPAILEAWYPGEEGGGALADVLFGDYNPAGRLPVTFYKSTADLPPFDDYRMEGRTYRFFKGAPLYPFGHGLSYTRFEYANLRVQRAVRAGANVEVTAEVRNAGPRAGDEVAQLYVTDRAASVRVPVRALAGARRLFLKPGERRRVSFTLTPRQLSVILDDGRRVVEPGEFAVSVGGKQPGFAGSADAATTGTVGGVFEITGEAFEVREK